MAGKPATKKTTRRKRGKTPTQAVMALPFEFMNCVHDQLSPKQRARLTTAHVSQIRDAIAGAVDSIGQTLEDAERGVDAQASAQPPIDKSGSNRAVGAGDGHGTRTI